jgi:hypothetical protein
LEGSVNRREMVTKGAWSMALLPFLMNNVHPKEYPTKKTKYCEHCKKEVAWRDVTLIETTAQDLYNDSRTYAIAGVITFHIDGTRCQEERVKIEKLEDPIVHVDHKAHRR